MKIRFAIIFLLISLTTQAQHMEAAGLTYLVQKPKVQSVKPTLLIMLHGFGSNEQDLMGLASYFPPQFTIVSARAPIALEKGSYAWYHLDLSTGKPIYDKGEAEKARQQILLFIAELRKQYNASEVLLIGFSQGAIMSYSVALTQPQQVKGIIALSGRVLSDIDAQLAPPEQLRKLHVFIGHGRNDQVLPFYNGEAAHVRCTKLETRVTFKDYMMGHEISGAELTDIQKWIAGLLVGN